MTENVWVEGPPRTGSHRASEVIPGACGGSDYGPDLGVVVTLLSTDPVLVAPVPPPAPGLRWVPKGPMFG